MIDCWEKPGIPAPVGGETLMILHSYVELPEGILGKINERPGKYSSSAASTKAVAHFGPVFRRMGPTGPRELVVDVQPPYG